MATRVESGELVLRSELPDIIGVNRARVHQLLHGGQLPRPALLTIGGEPLWKRSAVERWNRERKESTR